MSGEWRRRTVQDVAAQRTEQIVPTTDDSTPYVALEHIATGGGRLNGVAVASEAISNKTRFRAGDVLFGKLRPNLRKVVCAPYDGVCSTDIMAVTTKDGADKSFLYHLLASDRVHRHVLGDLTGTKMPRTSWRRLASFTFDCPPLSEQRAIAEVLDGIDDAIERTEAVIAATEELRRALLHDLLTGGVPGWHSEWKQVPDLGTIPACWEVVRLGALTESVVYGPRFPADKYTDDGNVATLRTTDISENGRISLATMPRARLPISRFEHYLLEQDDLVITRSGSCGIAAVFLEFELPVLPGAFLLRVRTRPTVESKFLEMWFNSEAGRRATTRIQAGGVQKNLNARDLSSLVLPVPPPYEREQMMAALGAIDRLHAESLDSRTQISLLKSGLADALLSGRVRVPLRREASG